MTIGAYEVQDELDSLVSGIVEAVRNEVIYSEYIGDKISEMHKKAFSNMYHHVTEKDGRLRLFLSPDDDSDTSCFLDLEQELIEYASGGDEYKERLFSLVSRVCERGSK